jgi:Protein of unknown function (DUF4231)
VLPQTSQSEGLGRELGDLIEQLQLPDFQKRMLRSRWLDQVLWMEGAAERARKKYYSLRLITIVGGVALPALVSLNLTGRAATGVSWVAFALSLVIAISAAVEEFFHYGEKWRHYRRNVEELKMEGWLFLQLSGRYQRHHSEHATAFPLFAGRVESILKRDVATYITDVVAEKGEEKEEVRSS